MTPTQAIERLRKMHEASTPPPWRRMGDGIVQTQHVTRDVWQIPRSDEDLDIIVTSHNMIPLLLAAVEAADRAKTLQVEYFRACALSGDDLVSRTRKQYEAAASAWSNFDFALSALARKVEEMDNA